MEKQIECPWCGKIVGPQSAVQPRKENNVIERSCPNCGKVVSAYVAGETFLDFIKERVLVFKD